MRVMGGPSGRSVPRNESKRNKKYTNERNPRSALRHRFDGQYLKRLELEGLRFARGQGDGRLLFVALPRGMRGEFAGSLHGELEGFRHVERERLRLIAGIPQSHD